MKFDVVSLHTRCLGHFHTLFTSAHFLSYLQETGEQLVTMQQALSSIDGIGEVTLEVFSRANYKTVEDLKSFDADDRRLQAAINDMKTTKPHFRSSYWHRLGTRCVNIIYRVQSSEASPVVPAAFTCPLTLDWFTDPVVAPSGHTYERVEIVEWITRDGLDPLTRQPIAASQLYPNRALLAAQDHYRRHHLKFSILI